MTVVWIANGLELNDDETVGPSTTALARFSGEILSWDTTHLSAGERLRLLPQVLAMREALYVLERRLLRIPVQVQ